MMDGRIPSAIGPGLRRAPGWIYLLSGLAVLSASLLLPPWLECRELAWRRDVMRQRLERLRDVREAYEDIQLAAERNDPVVLQRLAFEVLRVKPVGATLLEAEAARRPPRPIEAWVDPPPVREPAYEPVRSTLVRSTTGVKRYLAAAAGLMLIVGGLASSRA